MGSVIRGKFLECATSVTKNSIVESRAKVPASRGDAKGGMVDIAAQSTSASASEKKHSKINLPDGTVESLSFQNKMLYFLLFVLLYLTILKCCIFISLI